LKLRDHLFAILVHGGILAVIAVVVLMTSCQQKPPDPDPAQLFFRGVKDALNKASLDKVTVIQVSDSANAGPDQTRQVMEEVLNQLHKLEGIVLIEYPESRLESAFRDLKIKPSEGLSPDDAKALATQLGTSALIYASIESKTPDVHFKVYSGTTGEIIFANTLAAWKLPVKNTGGSALVDLGGGTASVGGAESSGVIGTKKSTTK
jgi:hypothetical protein